MVSGTRIAIIGNAGGGKSTLARKLGQSLGLPLIHVDSVQFQSGWERTATEECDEILANVVQGSCWIIDGFGSDEPIESRIGLADTVVFVDFPIWKHYWWALKRQWASRHGQRKELPDNCPEFSLQHTKKLIAIMWQVHKEYTPWFRKLLKRRGTSAKIIVLRNRSEWNKLASEVENETAYES